ncbi:hypothetical protein E4T49_07813 [Aureobasidium sp. EXF-10728]|nr:hypothetical protein E4T49_07813 [Aureobasidium sp. EXF-10728]
MLKGLKKIVASVLDPRIRLDDPTLQAIDLEELNRKGYINLPDSDFPINPDFEKKAKEHVTGAYIRQLRGWDPTISTIHPIFLPRRWKNVSQEDYNLLIPSLKLAGRLLDEPQILQYVKGFLKKPLPQINDQNLINKTGQFLYTFNTEPLRDWTSEGVWHTLWMLKDCISFEFSPQLPYGCTGMTQFGNTGSMIVMGADSAKVTLSSQFLDVFRGKLKASKYSVSWNPGSHDESAVLRAQFVLATILVHEVMHSLWITSNPTYMQHYAAPKQPEWQHPQEPYFRDGRINELGACWENLVFGGNVQMLGTPYSTIMPYGLTTVPFPGIWEWYPSAVSRSEDPTKWGTKWETRYLIEMKHIRKMFTNEMWDEVQRYGIKRLRRKRKLGYRTRLDLDKFPGLAPGEAAPGVPSSPHSSVASREGEEDQHGVVRRDPPSVSSENSFVIVS